MGDALREHFSRHGPSPLYVVVGRGGPNLVRGMGALAETCDSLNLSYRFFGFDSAISEVVNYAKGINEWMKTGGRAEVTAHLGLKPRTYTPPPRRRPAMSKRATQGSPSYP